MLDGGHTHALAKYVQLNMYQNEEKWSGEHMELVTQNGQMWVRAREKFKNQ